MKRAYIVTIFFFDNYGSRLQCYSMHEILKSLGCEAIFIDYKGHSSSQKLSWPKNLKDLFKLYKYYIISSFFRKYQIKKTRPLLKLKDVKEYPYKEGGFIVGSDQVWAFNFISPDSISFFFLDFIKQRKKIALAASFGTSDKDFKEKEVEIQKLLSDFDYITMREQSGIDILQDKLNIKSSLVLDPVVIWGDFSALTGKIKKREHELFTYIIQQRPEVIKNIQAVNSSFEKKFNLKQYNNIKLIKFASTELWVRRIQSAGFVLTDSFHVTCFAILGECQFAVLITQPERATRIEDLLKHLGLSDRLFYSTEELLQAEFKEKINYEIVNKKLKLLREASIIEFKNALATLI